MGHTRGYSDAVTGHRCREEEAEYAMSRAYGKKQRNSNRRQHHRGPGRSRDRVADRNHRAQLDDARTMTRVEPIAINRCAPGTVLLAHVDYTDGTGGKTRPVVVVRRIDRHSLLVFRCTTQGRNARARRLFEITDLAGCGLSRRTWVDSAPIVIERRAIIKVEGRLSDEDEARLFGAVGGEFGNGSQRVPA